MLSLLRRVANADACLHGAWVNDETISISASDPLELVGTSMHMSRAELVEHRDALLETNAPRRYLSTSVLLALPTPPAVVAVVALSTDNSTAARALRPPGRRDSVLILVWCQANNVPPAVRHDAPLLQRYLMDGVRDDPSLSTRDTVRLAAIMGVLPQGVAFIDERRVEGMVNDAAARWLRLTPGVHSGTDLAEAMRDLQRRVRDSVDLRADAAILASGVEISLHDRIWELTDPDGVVLRVSSVPVREGDESGRLWTFEDITLERAMMHETSQNRELELKLRQSQKLEAVGRLAAGLAHDFNNLLTVIGGSAAMLKSPALTEQQRADVADIEAATSRARRLTRQLLTFTSQQVEHPIVVDVDRHLRELGPLLSKVLAPESTLVLELGSPDASVFADPRSIELAVLNLLANARDAMGPGSSATLQTRVVELHDVRAYGTALPLNGPHVAIEVGDQGAGMDAFTRARIFEPFFTTKPEGHGTGLGLATVLAIAQRSGGGVTVESEVGVGTRVTILLPRVRSEQRAEQSDAKNPDDNGDDARRARILLVDDDTGPRQAVMRMLQHEGYAVTAVDSGRNAIAVLERHSTQFDAVVSDYMMPGMSGRELMQTLHERWPQLPLILTSGFVPDANTESELQRSMVSFIAKPFSAAEIVLLLDKVLASR